MINNETSMNTKDIQQTNRAENYSYNDDNLISGKGELSYKGDLRITGIFSGKLQVGGTLTIGASAQITGEIVVNDLIVFGQFVGSVHVTQMAVFHKGSALSGTLSANKAAFHRDSKISGKQIINSVIEIIRPVKKITDSPAEVILPITETSPLKVYKKNVFQTEDVITIPAEMTHSAFLVKQTAN